MNRRSFLRTVIGGVVVAAAAPSWPFRVFSFPSEIKLAGAMRGYHYDYIKADDIIHDEMVFYDKEAVRALMKIMTVTPAWRNYGYLMTSLSVG